MKQDTKDVKESKEVKNPKTEAVDLAIDPNSKTVWQRSHYAFGGPIP